MKDFALDHNSAGKWITPEVMLVSSLPLEDIDVSNRSELRERLFNLVKAKFRYKNNITIKNKTDDSGITCVVCLSDFCKIEMFESIHTLEKKFVVMFIGQENYKLIDGDFSVETFEYENGFQGFGTGSKKYIVTSTIRDIYELPVNAESKEDAIEKSKNYHVNDWHHLEDTDSNLNDVVFVRAARWGNFSVREAEQSD